MLNEILSDKSQEDTVNNIHEYLKKIGQEIKDGNIPAEKFVINKV